MKTIATLCALVLCAFGATTYAQSFANVDELLQLSEMDPLEAEKTLNSKGFKFTKTDGLESDYEKYNEGIEYQVSPRQVNYVTLDRLFFLEVNSRLLKQGFALTSNEATLEDDGATIKAQKYEKNKFVIWLWTSNDSGKTIYHIQVDNSSPSTTKKNASSTGKTKSDFKYKGDKLPADYGYFSIGLINPRGTIAEAPNPNSSYAQDYSGQFGLGAKKGFDCGFGGVLAFNSLNRKLPHGLDFGALLAGGFGVQPFSYESLSGYENHIFNGFFKVGGGIGPSLILTPFRESDFHISFYYKVDAAANFGGTFSFDGSDYDEELTRDAASFALIKSYGAHIYGGSLFAGVEFSDYIDKGSFTYLMDYYDSNGDYQSNTYSFNANLPIKQITVKVGLLF